MRVLKERDTSPLDSSFVNEELSRIKEQTNIRQQFFALERFSPFAQCSFPRNLTDENIGSLIDFAAEPESSPSLLVRAQALQLAFDSAFENERNGSSGPNQEGIVALMPKNLRAKGYAIKNPLFYEDTPKGYSAIMYRDALQLLASDEGLYSVMFPDWTSEGYTNEENDPVPEMALLLLQHLTDISDTPHKLPFSNAVKLVPFALDLNSALTTDMEFLYAKTKSGRAMVEDSKKIQDFLKLESRHTKPYIEAINSLQSAAKDLRSAFPEVYASGVEKAVHSLVASTVYAIDEHIRNGDKTSTIIPLNGSYDNGLPLHLEGDDPLMLMDFLTKSLQQLSDTVNDPNLQTSIYSNGDGYRVYRLWTNNTANNNVTVYIRPFGDVDFDSDIEYGRNGEGVEASVSYVVEPDRTAGLIEVGKHRGSAEDKRISIRLDREGIDQRKAKFEGDTSRDPTRQSGTLSLDVGSIIGDENWMSTKVGRFLAWGNVLRSRATQDAPQLNHVRDYFWYPCGESQVFAAAAKRTADSLELRKIPKRELGKRLAGTKAVANAQHIK